MPTALLLAVLLAPRAGAAEEPAHADVVNHGLVYESAAFDSVSIRAYNPDRAHGLWLHAAEPAWVGARMEVRAALRGDTVAVESDGGAARTLLLARPPALAADATAVVAVGGATVYRGPLPDGRRLRLTFARPGDSATVAADLVDAGWAPANPLAEVVAVFDDTVRSSPELSAWAARLYHARAGTADLTFFVDNRELSWAVPPGPVTAAQVAMLLRTGDVYRDRAPRVAVARMDAAQLARFVGFGTSGAALRFWSQGYLHAVGRPLLVDQSRPRFAAQVEVGGEPPPGGLYEVHGLDAGAMDEVAVNDRPWDGPQRYVGTSLAQVAIDALRRGERPAPAALDLRVLPEPDGPQALARKTLRSRRGAAVVDGVDSPGEWAGCQVVEVARDADDCVAYYSAMGGRDDFHARISSRWDDGHLYLIARVTDDFLWVAGADGLPGLTWHSDEVGWFFDLDHDATDVSFWDGMRPGDTHLFIDADPALHPNSIRWDKGTHEGHVWHHPAPPFPVAVRHTGDGYVVEAALPYAGLLAAEKPGWRPAVGTRVGFGIEMADADTTGIFTYADADRMRGFDKWGEIRWVLRGGHQTSWGDLLFTDEDDRVP